MTSANRITPFWFRIPKFFLYGLHPFPLAIIAILFVASYFFSGRLINLVYYVITIKYAAEALQHTAAGDLKPPRLSAEVINENFELPFKLYIVYLCYVYALGFILGKVTLLLAIPILVAFVLLLPAVIISLVVSEEIGIALNPLNWFNIAMRIGWPYLIMFFGLFLFGVVQSVVAEILLSKISASFIWPVATAIDAYFTIVMFHLMGYVVLQYHEELGEEAPAGLEEEDGMDDEYTTPLLKKFLAEGNIPAAIAEISSMIQNDPQNLELRRRMYVLLMSNGESERLGRYAPHYFAMLASANRLDDAAMVYLDSHERGEPFTPETAAHYLPVMRALRQRRKHREAIRMAQGFHKRFPNDPHTPELYLEMAKILSEELQRDDLAKNALGFVIKGFPGHAVLPEVKQYLGVLARLGAPVSAG